MKFIASYLTALLLLATTTSIAGEFDSPTTKPLTPQESSFLSAVEAGDLANLEGFLKSGGVPADLVHWELSKLLPIAEGEAHLKAISENSPASPLGAAAISLLAKRFEDAGEWWEAVPLLARLPKIITDEKEIAEALSRLLGALDKAGDEAGATRVAITLWTEYAHLPQSAEADIYLARKTGDPFKPVPGEKIFMRGKKLLEKGSRAEAVELFTKLRPRLLNGTKFLPELDMGLGKALYLLRRYDEALEPLGRAAKRAVDAKIEWQARFYRARSLFGLDRGDEGAADLVKLADKHKRAGQAPMWLYQAYKVFLGRKMYDESSRAKKKLMSRYPNSYEAVDVRWDEGWRLYRNGDFLKAGKLLTDSVADIREGWQRSRALYWGARALSEGGEGERSRLVYELLLSEVPLGYYARLARADLKGEDAFDYLDARTFKETTVVANREKFDAALAVEEFSAPAQYLRLGYPEAAIYELDRIGRRGPASGWLRYWAEDFHGAVEDASCAWYDWPGGDGGGVGEDCQLSFNPAFPASVMSAARDAGVHQHLLLAIARTESHFDQDAYSLWEARGLMQFIPATAKRIADELGLTNFSQDELFKPRTALLLGGRYLRNLLDKFDGNLVSAIASYNGGEAAVTKWRKARPGIDEAVFIELIPYRETRRYVKKVFTALDAYGRMDPEGLLK